MRYAKNMAVLLAANVGFIPSSPLHIAGSESAVRWGMEEINDRVASYGYGGVELHWSNVLKHCRELRTATPQDAARLGRGIVSMHESWRGVGDPQPRNADETLRAFSETGSMAVKLGSLAMFPTGPNSLRSLEAVEQKLGRPPDSIHYVMFPGVTGSVIADRYKTTRFPNSSIQPTADVDACWGTGGSIQNYVRALEQRGYGATIDSFHISRLGKVVDRQLDWEALSEVLLAEGTVKEVHISLARHDFAAVDLRRYQESVDEARGLVNNTSLENTSLGRLAGLLKTHNWAGNVVIEATIPGLSGTFGKMTSKLLAELHSGMTSGVKQLLPHIQWDSNFASMPQP